MSDKLVTIDELENCSSVQELKQELIETLSNDVSNEFLSVFTRVVEMDLGESFIDTFLVYCNKKDNIYDNICELAGTESLDFLEPENKEVLLTIYNVDDCISLKEIKDDTEEMLRLIEQECSEEVYYNFMGNLLNTEVCKDMLIDCISRDFLEH
jgi:hypothetical protein